MEDFIKDLGYKALDTRFKRISDRMAHDIRKVYKKFDIDIEPNWYLVFMILKAHQKLSIAEIAEKLNYAHPSVVVIIQKMKAKGYVITESDRIDKRKQLISLTEKSMVLLPKLEKLWHSCENSILTLLKEDLSILTHLDTIDNALKNTSFYERFTNEYSKHTL